MKNIILSAVSVSVLFVGAALIVPSFIDWSQYKDQIKAQVESSTGYKLEINGPLKAAFLPTPHVNIENVSIDSAGAKGPYAFKGKIEKASVSLALFPLLGGDIEISNVSLINPVLDVKEQKFTEEKVGKLSSSEETGGGGSSKPPTVVVENLSIQGAKISYKPLKGEVTNIEISTLSLEADSLMGPFEFDGSVVYNGTAIMFDGSSDEYTKTEPFSVSLDVKGDGYDGSYSGVVDLSRADIALQGEVRVALSDPQSMNIPIKDNITLSGLLTATPKAAKIDNGSFSVGDAKGRLMLNASGLDTKNKVINGDISLSSALDLDALLAKGEISKKSSNSSAKVESSSSVKTSYAFLPDTIEIPGGLDATLKFSVPTVSYKGKDIEGVQIDSIIKGSNVTVKAVVDQLPDGGSVAMNVTVKGESASRNGSGGAHVLSNPSVLFDGDITLKSLKSLTVDWLGAVDASAFDAPAMPKNAKGTIKGSIKGNVAIVSFPELTASDYKIKDAKATYTNKSTPLFDLKIGSLNGARIAVSGKVGDTKTFHASIKHANAKKAIQIIQKDFQSDALALQKPLSLQADIAISDTEVAVNNMAASLGTVKTKGTLVAKTGGSKPSIKADLTFETLDTQS